MATRLHRPHPPGPALLWLVGFMLLAATLVSCAVGGKRILGDGLLGSADSGLGFRGTSGSDSGTAPVMIGGPRLDHAAHIERGLECSDCHEADEETGELTPVPLDTCQGCHEEIDEELPKDDPNRVVPTFFDENGASKWAQALLTYDSEILFAHGPHLKGRECSSCHGDMAGTGPREQRTLFAMADCMACHKEAAAPNDCASCHKEIRRDKAPPSHGAGWHLGHGVVSPTGLGESAAQSCDLCHSVPNDCQTCHTRTPPASHASADFKREHGQTLLNARGPAVQQRCDMCHHQRRDCDACHEEEVPLSHRRNWRLRHGHTMRGAGTFDQARCAYCHADEQFCERCHKIEAPRNHTMLFRNKSHGTLASIDRESCKTCHNTPFCIRCHETAEPRSHRGQWATGRNTHCAGCHYPLAATQGCWVCHKTNPTHSTAPPMKAGHNPAWNCRVCHNSAGGGGAPPLKHFDNGQACQSCHQ
jgi:hypothetical protein